MKKNLLIIGFLTIVTSFVVYLALNPKDTGCFSLVNDQRITAYYHDKIYLAYILSATSLIIGYMGMSLFIRHRKETNEICLSRKWGVFIRSLIIISLVTSIVTFAYSPETPLTALVKNTIFNDHSSTTNHLELRLAMQNLPTILQFLFEFERRIIIPFLLIEVFCQPLRNALPTLLKILLLLVTSFNVFFTIDRVIGATYLFTIIASLFYIEGTSFFKHKKFWIFSFLLLSNVVILKHFQYGEFWTHDKMANLDWKVVHFGSRGIKTPIDRRTLTSEKDSRTGSVPLEKVNVISSGIFSSVEKQSNNGSEKSLSPVFTTQLLKSVLRYYRFATSSLTERVFLSPLQMLSYSFHEFNQGNFLNFKYIRVLSFVGLTNYVKPSQVDDQKYNKSFPLGYLGDLWRNGGWISIIIYSFCLGIILLVIDRGEWNNSFISPKIIGLVGTISLFYSNAFSGTSICLLAASFLLSIPFISVK